MRESEYGKSINLGMEFCSFTQDFYPIYKSIDLNVDYIERLGSNVFSAIINTILKNNDKQFFVSESSRYCTLLQKHIASGKISVCKNLDNFFAKQNSFVFIDEKDEDFCKNAELLSIS